MNKLERLKQTIGIAHSIPEAGGQLLKFARKNIMGSYGAASAQVVSQNASWSSSTPQGLAYIISKYKLDLVSQLHCVLLTIKGPLIDRA